MISAILPTLLAAEAVAEEGGGLFDINATLPLMAVQFLILTVILNALFYKPLGQAIDERADYIRDRQQEAKQRLAKAEALAQQYENELADSRRQSQAVVADAQAEAQKLAAGALAQAQQEAQAQREKAQQEIDQQRQTAMAALDAQVDTLSRQIVKKLLGYELG